MSMLIFKYLESQIGHYLTRLAPLTEQPEALETVEEEWMEEDEDELLVQEEDDNDDSKVSISDKMEFINTEDVATFEKCVNTNNYHDEDDLKNEEKSIPNEPRETAINKEFNNDIYANENENPKTYDKDVDPCLTNTGNEDNCTNNTESQNKCVTVQEKIPIHIETDVEDKCNKDVDNQDVDNEGIDIKEEASLTLLQEQTDVTDISKVDGDNQTHLDNDENKIPLDLDNEGVDIKDHANHALTLVQEQTDVQDILIEDANHGLTLIQEQVDVQDVSKEDGVNQNDLRRGENNIHHDLVNEETDIKEDGTQGLSLLQEQSDVQDIYKVDGDNQSDFGSDGKEIHHDIDNEGVDIKDHAHHGLTLLQEQADVQDIFKGDEDNQTDLGEGKHKIQQDLDNEGSNVKEDANHGLTLLPEQTDISCNGGHNDEIYKGDGDLKVISEKHYTTFGKYEGESMHKMEDGCIPDKNINDKSEEDTDCGEFESKSDLSSDIKECKEHDDIVSDAEHELKEEVYITSPEEIQEMQSSKMEKPQYNSPQSDISQKNVDDEECMNTKHEEISELPNMKNVCDISEETIFTQDEHMQVNEMDKFTSNEALGEEQSKVIQSSYLSEKQEEEQSIDDSPDIYSEEEKAIGTFDVIVSERNVCEEKEEKPNDKISTEFVDAEVICDAPQEQCMYVDKHEEEVIDISKGSIDSIKKELDKDKTTTKEQTLFDTVLNRGRCDLNSFPKEQPVGKEEDDIPDDKESNEIESAKVEFETCTGVDHKTKEQIIDIRNENIHTFNKEFDTDDAFIKEKSQVTADLSEANVNEFDGVDNGKTNAIASEQIDSEKVNIEHKDEILNQSVDIPGGIQCETEKVEMISNMRESLGTTNMEVVENSRGNSAEELFCEENKNTTEVSLDEDNHQIVKTCLNFRDESKECDKKFIVAEVGVGFQENSQVGGVHEILTPKSQINVDNLTEEKTIKNATNVFKTKKSTEGPRKNNGYASVYQLDKDKSNRVKATTSSNGPTSRITMKEKVSVETETKAEKNLPEVDDDLKKRSKGLVARRRAMFEMN